MHHCLTALWLNSSKKYFSKNFKNRQSIQPPAPEGWKAEFTWVVGHYTETVYRPRTSPGHHPWLNWLNGIPLHGKPIPITELRSVTCHMGSHGVTCHPTQVNAPHHNPSHAGRYSIYLPRRDGRLSWPCYTAGVELTSCWSQVQRPNRYASASGAGTEFFGNIFSGSDPHVVIEARRG